MSQKRLCIPLCIFMCTRFTASENKILLSLTTLMVSDSVQHSSFTLNRKPCMQQALWLSTGCKGSVEQRLNYENDVIMDLMQVIFCTLDSYTPHIPSYSIFNSSYLICIALHFNSLLVCIKWIKMNKTFAVNANSKILWYNPAHLNAIGKYHCPHTRTLKYIGWMQEGLIGNHGATVMTVPILYALQRFFVYMLQISVPPCCSCILLSLAQSVSL